MQCLQENFETDDFKGRYKNCYEELRKFTEYESKDIKLNRALTKACRPVIDAHCNVRFIVYCFSKEIVSKYRLFDS